MKYPSPEEVQQIKASALERFGQARAELVELDAPIDVAVVMAPFDLASWRKLVDAHRRDVNTANASAFAQRLLWPSLAEGLELREKWPALANRVMRQMVTVAGETPEEQTAARLSADALARISKEAALVEDAVVREALVKEMMLEAGYPAGLSEAHASALFSAHPGAALWAVELPSQGLACVLKAPLADVWLAASTEDSDARKRGENVIGSMERYILETVLWSASPIGAVLDQRPALIGELRTAYVRMGGGGPRSGPKAFEGALRGALHHPALAADGLTPLVGAPAAALLVASLVKYLTGELPRFKDEHVR